MRSVHVQPPAELGKTNGLAYALFLPGSDDGRGPAGSLAGGVVVLHGAGSCKENHFDFARALRAAGIAAVVFDQRGHGESEGALGASAFDDVATVAALLPPGPVALRGSSMGGFIALIAGARMDVAALVAICPATGEMLARGLNDREFDFRADEHGLRELLLAADERDAAEKLGERLLLLHAEGDDRVPIQISRDLHAAASGSRLVAVPGGDHRSVQHDAELQALAVRFIARALRPRRAPG
jgi:pimeloyl-ACP methyl ester carboxylesterase